MHNLIQVQIMVDTDALLEKFPQGGDAGYGDPYIKMTIVDGIDLVTDVTANDTGELGFSAAQDTYLRFFCLSSSPAGDVQIIRSGNIIPSQCLVNGSFNFKNGKATGKTVKQTVAKTAYNFVLEIDDMDFMFTWDPFLGVI